MSVESSEEYILLADVGPRLPHNPSQQAVARWAKHGLLSEGGTPVILKTVKIGGRRFTTASALSEFISQLNSNAPTENAFASRSSNDIDEYVPIANASCLAGGNHCRRTGKRWAREGILDSSGNVVKLETKRIGGRLFTTKRMINAFLEKTQS